MKPCPTCPALTPTGARCTDCKRKQRAASRRRNPAQQARPHTWRTTARQFLTEHPTCERCGKQATVVDHAPPRRLLLALDISRPDHPPYLHPLCTRCHNRITQTIDVPLLRRLDNGDDPQRLAELSLEQRYTPSRPTPRRGR